MSMKSHFLTVTVLMQIQIGTICLGSEQSPDYLKKQHELAKNNPVSLISLIATPEKYDGKVVQTEGYMHKGFEDCSLSPSKEFADHFLSRSAIWLQFDAPDIDTRPYSKTDLAKNFGEKYVILEGIFDKNDKGHESLFAGTLKQISRIYSRVEHPKHSERDIPLH